MPGLKERLRIAEDRARRLEEVLLSKHGGEPFCLIDEIDELREQIEKRDSLLLYIADRIKLEGNSDGGIVARIDYLCGAANTTPK